MAIITDANAALVLDLKKTYTIVYRDLQKEQTDEERQKGLRHPKSMKIKVLNGLYHNYPHDSWIGHDSEDGRNDPLGERVYFDGEEVPDYIPQKEILWIGTDEDWQNFLKAQFTF